MKNKIVLFRPKPNQEQKPLLSAPLSLLTAASLLDKEGFDIKIIDAIVDCDYHSLVLKHAKDAICFGVTAITGYQIRDGLKMSRLVKENYSHIPVIWGGWHPTIIPLQTVANPYVDIVVKGQGEITFRDTVYSLVDNKPLTDIPGIVFKKNGRLINNPDRPIQDLNLFPAIPYHLVDVDKYIHMTDMGYRTLDYRISQGCPFRCNFCAEHLMSARRWVALSPERIFGEFKQLKDAYSIDSIMLLENNTFVDKDKIRRLCQLIIESNLDIRWGNVNVRPNQILDDAGIWSLLKRSGCHSLLVGAESGLQDILDLINKDTKIEDIIYFKRRCSENNIRPFISFMIGFPNKTIDIKRLRGELDSILDVIDKIRKIDNRQQIFISIYMPYPGTPLFKLAIECGMKEPGSLEEWSGIDLTKAYSPWVTKSFARKIGYLNEFIFPYSCNILDEDWEKFVNKKRFPVIIRILKKILGSIASFRLKNRFFYFPIEWWLLKIIKK